MEEIVKDLNKIILKISQDHKIVDTETMIKLHDVREKLKALIIPVVVKSFYCEKDKYADKIRCDKPCFDCIMLKNYKQ